MCNQSPEEVFLRAFGALTVLVSLLFLGLVAATAAVLWVFWTYGKDCGLSPAGEVRAAGGHRIHAGNGALIAEHATENAFHAGGGDAAALIQAFLSAEDKAFYSHFGVDPRALFRAVVTNAMNYGTGRRPDRCLDHHAAGDEELPLTNEVSIDRKIKEAILSLRMERALPRTRSWPSI